MTEISFYLPEAYLPTAAWRQAWAEGKIVSLQEHDKDVTMHSWIYQTWALLKEAGIFCNLVTQLPTHGIVIALSGLAGNAPSRSGALFRVDIVAHGLPDPEAHLALIHNKTHARYLPRSLFIPHWPQPYLIPRDPERGNRFENICFFGEEGNLASELRAEPWQQRLQKELGLKMQFRGAAHWHEYADIDCVLALRDFSPSLHLQKPATKLYNAWLAGVPFIGGRDSAYAADGHPGKDYLVATSSEEIFQQLKRLKEEEDFRSELVRNGLQSGAAFTREATLECWKKLLQETLPRLAYQWQQKSKLQRSWFLFTQYLFCLIDHCFIVWCENK